MSSASVALHAPDKLLPPPRALGVCGLAAVVGQLHVVVEDGGVLRGHADLDDLEAAAAPQHSEGLFGQHSRPLSSSGSLSQHKARTSQFKLGLNTLVSL